LRFCRADGIQAGNSGPRNGSIWRSNAICSTRFSPDDAGAELRALAREENPTAILKSWEDHDLLEMVHPVLAEKNIWTMIRSTG